MKSYTNELTGEEVQKTGACFLIYGYPESGKTHALGTLEEPIAIVVREPRDPRRVLSWCKKSIKFYEPESFDESEELYHKMEKKAKEGTLPFKSIADDSLSFLQTTFKMTLEDNRFQAQLDKDKVRDGLIDRFALSEADWGPMGSTMQRITAALNRLSKYGIITVATATVMERPRWNRNLSYAPAFAGRQYGTTFNGYFDFIGFITEGVKIYPDRVVPPTVSFVSPEEDYVAKCCNLKLAQKGSGGLNFEKILKVIE